MTYKEILEKMIKTGMSAPLSDIESGSVMKALIDADIRQKKYRLIKFLTKLDSRFRKFHT